MIARETLVALALGELEGADADAAAEHVLECGACAAQLERLAAIGVGVGAIVGEGKARLALTPALRERMQRDGLVSRTYVLRPGEIVACTVSANDLYALVVLEADLRGVERVDVVRGDQRIEDLPIDRERGVVTFVQRSDFIRTLPSHDIHLSLIAVEAGRDRKLGEYTLRHSALAP